LSLTQLNNKIILIIEIQKYYMQHLNDNYIQVVIFQDVLTAFI